MTRSGDRVRITAQLIDARSDKHLWAESFERKSSDVLALQAELASAIASEINVRLTPGEQSRLSAAPSVNPVAHDAYLKGRYFFNRPSDENLQKAIAQFEAVVTLSPTFAPAYSGLSDAYTWAAYYEGFISAADAKPRAKESAERAVALDSLSAEAHTSLGVYEAPDAPGRAVDENTLPGLHFPLVANGLQRRDGGYADGRCLFERGTVRHHRDGIAFVHRAELCKSPITRTEHTITDLEARNRSADSFDRTREVGADLVVLWRTDSR